MHIKKFEAGTMEEAIGMVKSELGPDAVIMSTKTSRKGIASFGLFGAPSVEVTAALDRSPAQLQRGDAGSPGSGRMGMPAVSGRFMARFISASQPMALETLRQTTAMAGMPYCSMPKSTAGSAASIIV